LILLNLRQKFGKFGEDLAVRYLKRKGYQVLCRNYRTRFGEIDIIAKDSDTLVFVEVKSRQTSSFGNPKYSITHEKQKRISKTALYYLKINDQSNCRARFDVVTVTKADKKTSVEIIKNAFELAYK
jgi:putative endonuclease